MMSSDELFTAITVAAHRPQGEQPCNLTGHRPTSTTTAGPNRRHACSRWPMDGR
jgi:hypothetical protein